MAWNYSGDPADSSRDAVRWYVGDTDTNDQLVLDEEINYILGLQTDVVLAAADVCEAISAKFSRQADTTNLSISIRASQRSVAYMSLAKDLRLRAALICQPFFGGQTLSGKDSLNQSTDAVLPSFTLGLDDIPGGETAPDEKKDQ